ncbi:MAG: hypothetical protein DWQ07_08550 [Chloroflexi bacterium]|nr:MAG: hypothetical protein DWQ07_08550 [Chloroflexota bacterium]MBL1193238.1 hypothetical protein [Chloroflexota bacterium]NOH10533.1 hypothetical protein [Chloroflexota bacterium]
MTTDSKPRDVLLSGRGGSRNLAIRKRLGVAITLVGLLVYLLGAEPDLFGLDRSPVIGFIQIMVLLAGLGIICLGGYLIVDALWHTRGKTIAADIGLRIMATGYVIALATGTADLIGLGTRPLPSIPFFGYWQARGVLLGQIVILLGFLLMLPYGRWRKSGKRNGNGNGNGEIPTSPFRRGG